MGTWRVMLLLSVICMLVPDRSLRGQESPHGTLALPCESCHDTESWEQLAFPLGFRHGTTGFLLEGTHAQVPCRQCHTTLRFSEATAECSSCHQDVHRKELGSDCERCHTPVSWLVPDMPQRHLNTRFALLGAHRLAQCRSCHTNEQKHTYTGVPIDCIGCHGPDYAATTAPPHRASGIGTDCESCHAVSAFTWAAGFDHAQTGFPLTGGHAAVPCSQCHRNNVYAGLSPDCYSCHQQEYTGTTNPAHASSGFPTTCETCHGIVAWSPSTFDHEPSFPISAGSVHRPGRWSACADCHTSMSDFRIFSCLNCHEHAQARMDAEHSGNARYSYASQACYSCHPRGRE